jgi:ubiquinol-cytochrome c reductase cytochrome b subunit
MKLRVAIPVLVLFFSSFAFASTRVQRARGEAVFDSSGCRHCHSIGGAGGHKGPDLSNVGRTKMKTAIRSQIVYGSREMPEFGDVLEHRDIDDLIAFLRSCREKISK